MWVQQTFQHTEALLHLFPNHDLHLQSLPCLCNPLQQFLCPQSPLLMVSMAVVCPTCNELPRISGTAALPLQGEQVETCPSSHFPETGEETSPVPPVQAVLPESRGRTARAGTRPQPSPTPGRAHGSSAGRAWGRWPGSGAVGRGSEPVPGGPARRPGSSASLTRRLCSARSLLPAMC